MSAARFALHGLTVHSRLINHSCDPSASAKIISINGHSKVRLVVRMQWAESFMQIVIYAKRTLHPGEEVCLPLPHPHDVYTQCRSYTIINSRSNPIQHCEYPVYAERPPVEAGSTRRPVTLFYLASASHAYASSPQYFPFDDRKSKPTIICSC